VSYARLWVVIHEYFGVEHIFAWTVLLIQDVEISLSELLLLLRGDYDIQNLVLELAFRG
jgi:hypothetical protein